jgi:uncharacterized protein
MRMPDVPFDRALGVGFDLAYGDSHGLVPIDGGGYELAWRVRRYLAESRRRFGYAFFSFQPRDRGLLDPRDYVPIWDRLIGDVPQFGALGLHHTMLNLGSIDANADRSRLLDFTNALIERYQLRWVNEDVGIWSIDGKSLPYPLPPILTEQGLDAATRHVEEVQHALSVPLVLEFPGFSEGSSFVVGNLDAYDFFRRLAQRTGAPVTLDTGHLLSWRWLCGHRDAALFAELDRLPLAQCFELHVSGCQIIDGRFRDVHHGIATHEQMELLQRLLDQCPNARAVTYEDPKLTPEGELRPKARAGFARLEQIVSHWIARPGRKRDAPAA